MMDVITKKMLMMTAFVTLMAAFVTAKMLMMATNMVNLTMSAFVNDGCNPLLMMDVILLQKCFFSYGFNMPTDLCSVKVVLPSHRWSLKIFTNLQHESVVSDVGKTIPDPQPLYPPFVDR
jgi:hypothetical protein